MSHLKAIFFAFVGVHIGDDNPSPFAQYPANVGQRSCGFGKMVQDEEQRRGIERAVIDRE